MGRPGGGGGGGHHSSSHSHSSNRTSSSHRVGSSRPSSGPSSSRSYSSGRSYSPGRTSVHVHNHYGRSYGYGRSYTVSHHSSSMLSVVISFIILVVFLCVMMSLMSGSSGNVPKSTQNRTKLDTGWYDGDVTDEIGWLSGTGYTRDGLQAFWKKTGVQPYVYLKAYDPLLTSDAAKEQWAQDHFDIAGLPEEGFLFVYFAEEDSDNDIGLMTVIQGNATNAVMDAEATNIFWAYIDQYWYSDLEMDDMLIKAFSATADRIMDKTTTGADVGKVFGIGFVVIVATGAVILIMVNKRKSDREKAENTAKVLNADIGELSSNVDKLAEKYNHGGK